MNISEKINTTLGLNIQWWLLISIFIIVILISNGIRNWSHFGRILGTTLLIYMGFELVNGIYTGKLPDNTKELEYYAH